MIKVGSICAGEDFVACNCDDSVGDFTDDPTEDPAGEPADDPADDPVLVNDT